MMAAKARARCEQRDEASDASDVGRIAGREIGWGHGDRVRG